MTPARREAFRILHRVETQHAYASNLLASDRLDQLSVKDRGLAYELVLGVLRWQRQLDYFIERYTGRSVETLDVPVVLALRLGLYQIRFLERIPDSAAVHESVQLVKKHGATSAASLVNAVLRTACRQRDDQPGENASDDPEQLSIEFSHPRWLVEKWVAQFGRQEAIALMQANNVPPPTALWINTRRACEEEIRAQLESPGRYLQASRHVPGAYLVSGGTLNPQAAIVRSGQVYIQDEASQLIAGLLEPEPGLNVLDVCAAPGGKCSLTAIRMENHGLIVAGDIHPHRLRSLKRTSRRLGIEIISPVVLDGTRPPPFWRRFDRVLVDAPCSGTGTLRRNPEIKWRLKPEDIRTLADVQFQLLQAAGEMVAADGLLVYSTCSVEREENEMVVGRFITARSDFEKRRPPVAPVLLQPDNTIRTFPHRDGMDGFFATVLARKR
jgi:16S rRNA (cytosine967-C5)-methyltransferase